MTLRHFWDNFFLVYLSMFLSIINDSFCRTRENLNDNQETFSFMLSKFQRWIGMKVELV
jgi:hypothetical protein